MKTLYFIVTTFVFLSCQHADKINAVDTNKKEEFKRDSIYNFLFTNDSVVINIVEGDTTVYYKKDFIFLEKNYSFLFTDEFKPSPEVLYERLKENPNDTLFNNFSSEAGQDGFYELYAYLLSIKNGVEKYKTERRKLIDIYQTINSVHAKLNGGGTGYGHISNRIYGYAEYSISLIESTENNYDINKQKQLFIQSLRQFVDDEMNIKKDMTDKEKKEMHGELYKLIEELNSKIDNFFYLKMAREFEYSRF